MTLTRREFTQAALGTAALTACGVPAIAGPHGLIKKAIPSSGEKVPIVGLGTNRYGVGDDAAAREPLRGALKRFHELGGTVIDTAPMYRSSEAVLGDLIDELGIRDDLFIATKTDKEPGGESTVEQMHESQRRLHTKKFELMQVHNLRDWKNALPKIRDWKDAGLVRYSGITTSNESQYGEFEQVMQRQALDFIQINYSIDTRGAAERILPLAADKGIAVIINRAFGSGRLFDAVKGLDIPEWADDFGCGSWAQFFLKYAIGHPAATLSIPGMTKLHHVDDNLGAMHGRLPDAGERQKMEAFFDAL